MEIASLILNFILGSGIISMLFFYRSKRRKADAEANTAEINNEHTEVERLEARLKVRDDKIDTMYIESRNKEKAYIELLKKCYELELANKIAEIKRCDIRGCIKRQPPGEY